MWIVCITSVRHVLTVNGYGGRQTKENEKSWCFKGWETLVIYSKHLERIIKVFPNTPNVHELVINAAMFVSTSDFEGLSNSMLEALSMGLPTICTDCPCGGARMVIEDGVNGFLIPVNNQKSLVDKMLLIAGSSELTIKLSNNALKINNKLNVDNICKQWISLL